MDGVVSLGDRQVVAARCVVRTPVVLQPDPGAFEVVGKNRPIGTVACDELSESRHGLHSMSSESHLNDEHWLKSFYCEVNGKCARVYPECRKPVP